MTWVPGRLALTALLACGACAISPQPTSPEERAQRAQNDQAVLAQDQEPVTAPLTLYDCMARAIRYNYEHRLRAMEGALALGLTEQANFDLLPRMVASAGYTQRNNETASTSETILNRIPSSEPATSQEKARSVASLQFSWNILDFGVTYLRARQQANRAMIAEERRRKVVQTIIQQVRSAYWRAVAFERLQSELVPLEKRIQSALAVNQKLESQRLRPPEELLQFRKALLDILHSMQGLRRDIAVARTELAGLMNVPPGQGIRLATDQAPQVALNGDAGDIRTLLGYALVNRPELREEDYQTRIGVDEAELGVLRLLPGVDLTFGGAFDSNRFLVNNLWAEAGARLTWNLMNLLSLPTTLENADKQAEIAHLRRRAVHMAVATQVQVAWLRQREARDEYRVSEETRRIDDRLYELAAARERTATGDELTVIQREAGRLYSRTRRDLALAEFQQGVGALLVSVGVDPLPMSLEANDLAALAATLRATLGPWEDGRLNLPASAAPSAGTVTPAGVPDAEPVLDLRASEAPAVGLPGGSGSGRAPANLFPWAGLSASAAVAPSPEPRSAARGASSGATPRRPAPVDASGAPAPAAREAVMQLGSFKDPDNVSTVWSDLQRRHPRLADYTFHMDEVAAPDGGVLYRLTVHGDDRELRSLCSTLRGQGGTCQVHHGEPPRAGGR